MDIAIYSIFCRYNYFSNWKNYQKMGRSGRCSFLYCCHRKSFDKCFFALFPKDIERCRKWIQVVGDQDLLFLSADCLTSKRFVCGCHFKNDDYSSEKRNRLKSSAIPSIFNSKIKPLTNDEILEYPVSNPILISTDAKRVTVCNTTTKNIRQTPGNVDAAVSADAFPSQTTSPLSNINSLLPVVAADLIIANDLVPCGPSNSSVIATTFPYDIAEEIIIDTTAGNASITSIINNFNNSIEKPISECNVATSRPKRIRASNATQRISLKKMASDVGLPPDTELSPNMKIVLQALRKKNAQVSDLQSKLSKLTEKHNALQKEVKRRSFNVIKDIKSPALREIVDLNLQNQNRKSHGRRYTLEQKMLAIEMQMRGGNAGLKLLSNTMALPTRRTIHRTIKKLSITPGFNVTELNAIKNDQEFSDVT